MRYEVKTLGERDLPPGHDWAIVIEPGRMTACVRHSRAGDPEVLAEAWAAVRHTRERLLLPA